MSDRSPAVQFYFRQFSGDDEVQAMDLDTVGAHILLMCAAGASPEGYRIPTDERAIRNRLRNPSEQDWQRIKTQLLRGAWKIDPSGQWWEQSGLRRSFEKQRAFSQAQRERVNKRYRKSTDNLPGYNPKLTDSDSGDLPETYSSSSSQEEDIYPSNPEKIVEMPAEDLATVRSVFDYYLAKTGRSEKLYEFTPARKRKGLRRLGECLKKAGGNVGDAEQLMRVAVDGLSGSDWHMGRDPKTNGKRYCEWESHLFGTFEGMESWWRQETKCS